ncbi:MULTISPECIES: hypothetical protein [unclassified Campylobacter]|uniref:hypothetical protein n=1 Tax=unclassified Campylobacter TaxID=2593542 RepID=UPI0022E9EC60|nr:MULTISPECIES: hypothetical protein [unclassified Campylobacter]MDA3078972.1 hypothetical protein [Campylobacter sp. CS_NA2]MDA3080737.1 hypothetical protein [Campylobacter sp. CS_NA1]MDA3085059.1 hypothetical protein [Campylobacter sp. CS_ED1]MDA3089835.1 hypothetical protein [Campylobacter sp. CS_ED2]WBR51608.1 hypothetical protein PF026_01835 [Campylobacter sp. CS_NA3]
MIVELMISDEKLENLKRETQSLYTELIKDKENIVKNFEKYLTINVQYTSGTTRFVLALLLMWLGSAVVFGFFKDPNLVVF